MHPYDCIGLVLSYYAGDVIPTLGTGFLIGERHVLTVAHNVYNKNRSKTAKADKIFFIPNANGKPIEKGRIGAQIHDISQYAKAHLENQKDSRSKDFGLLMLEGKVERQKYLSIQSEEPPLISESNPLRLCGFPADKL